MAIMNMTTEQGIEAVRLGDVERGRTLLRQAVAENPGDEKAWLWLSTIAGTTEGQLECLRHVLEINPFNHAARRDLAAIPPRFHYAAPAAAVGAPIGATTTGKTFGAQRATNPAWGAASVATAIPISSQQAWRNVTTIGASPAAKSPGASGGTQAIPAIVIPAPTLLEPLDEQPRDPDYSPVQTLTARKFAQGVVRKKGVSVPHLGRIALGTALVALIVLLLLALMIDRSRKAAVVTPQPTVAPTRATAAPRATTTINPNGRLFGTGATAITGAHGTVNVPGTAFVDGRVLDANPPWTLDVIWVWGQPFEASNVTCKIPHGSAVLLLETQTSPGGQVSVHIQRRDCSGWVSADLLSPKAVPPIGPVRTDDNGVTEK